MLARPSHNSLVIRVRTLGSISVEGLSPGQSDDLAKRRKPFALLVYLLLAKEPGAFHQRDALCALLWPESTQARSRSSLRQALTVIGRHLGAVIERRGMNELRLAPASLESDVAAFGQACNEEAWWTAVRLYRGSFLEGFHADGAPAFERWLDAIQLKLRQHYKKALERLASDESNGTDALTRSTL